MDTMVFHKAISFNIKTAFVYSEKDCISKAVFYIDTVEVSFYLKKGDNNA